MSNESKFIDHKLIIKKAEIGEDMKIADLGCGKLGYFVLPAAKLVGKKGIIYAVDILKTVLETVKRRAKVDNIKNIKYIWSNLEIFNATIIESGSVDIVFLVNTLYQSKKRAEILREAVRILKKDGRILIVEWKKIALPFGPPPEERVNSKLLKQAAPKLGLEFGGEFPAGQFHYGLIFTKI